MLKSEQIYLTLAADVCVQVVDLYWGVDPEEWDSPELQRLRMKLLEECLKTSAGPCFVVSTNIARYYYVMFCRTTSHCTGLIQLKHLLMKEKWLSLRARLLQVLAKLY